LLELKVGTDPALPRQQLTSHVYAFKADIVPDGAITTAKSVPAERLPDKP
jgi:hypothetical protein